AKDLTRIYEKIFRKKALIISYTSKNDVSVLEDSLGKLLADISDAEVEDKKLSPVLEVKNEGFKTASKVQYVATAANYRKTGLEYTGALNVLQIIFSYDYLWINVRVKGGAYGAMCDFTRSGLAFMTSYRDPNLGETYQIYKKAVDYVKNFDCSDRDMVKYIIGTVAKMDAPMTPLMEGVFSFGCYICGITDEERQASRDAVLGATQETIRGLAPYVQTLADSDVICAVGSEEKINESSELFKEITKLY
ncbi:MAG: insulinase family protein, partial [Eubacterium sp.]|nr:insulinase family protein [Eubacterium sp.]